MLFNLVSDGWLSHACSEIIDAHVPNACRDGIYLLGGNVMSLWLMRDSSKSQLFGGSLQMLLGFVLLNLLVTAGNLSPIRFFDHSSNTKLNDSMDTSESTEELKKSRDYLYHKQKNNQIQFRKIIKANAFGKKLHSVRETNAQNVFVVVSQEQGTFSIRNYNLELFGEGLCLIKQRGKNPKLCLGIFHCEKGSRKLQCV